MQIDMNTVLKEDISEEIQKVEKYNKIKFPQSYVAFIKEYNVGVPLTKCRSIRFVRFPRGEMSRTGSW